MTLFYPDWSNNNWSSSAQAVAACAEVIFNEGYSAIVHKVSEGADYADPYWPAVRDWCWQHDVPVIGYHYVKTDSPPAQVRNWLNNGGGNNLMLDFEANSGNIVNFWNVVNAFGRAGVNLRLSYIPWWYWQQIGSPDISQVPGLISSGYNKENDTAVALYESAGGDTGMGWWSYGGATPVIWQFCDAARMAGFTADANAFKGSVADLRSLLGYPKEGPFMALSDVQQQQLFDAVLDIQTQLRGIGLHGWPQLGKNAKGENLTVVDAIASIEDAVTAIEGEVKK